MIGNPKKVKKKTNITSQQSIQIYIKLSDNNLGDEKDEKLIYSLEEKLIKIIEQTKVGEYDFHEFGAGFCTIYIYGGSADRIHQAIWSELKKVKFPKKSYLIKYLGNKQEKEVIDLNAPIN
jgi:hypothetical protein